MRSTAEWNKSDRERKNPVQLSLWNSSIHIHRLNGKHNLWHVFIWSIVCLCMYAEMWCHANTDICASPPKNTLISIRKLWLPSPIHLPAILFYFSGAVSKGRLSRRTKVYWPWWNQALGNTSARSLSFICPEEDYRDSKTILVSRFLYTGQSEEENKTPNTTRCTTFTFKIKAGLCQNLFTSSRHINRLTSILNATLVWI